MPRLEAGSPDGAYLGECRTQKGVACMWVRVGQSAQQVFHIEGFSGAGKSSLKSDYLKSLLVIPKLTCFNQLFYICILVWLDSLNLDLALVLRFIIR